MLSTLSRHWRALKTTQVTSPRPQVQIFYPFSNVLGVRKTNTVTGGLGIRGPRPILLKHQDIGECRIYNLMLLPRTFRSRSLSTVVCQPVGFNEIISSKVTLARRLFPHATAGLDGRSPAAMLPRSDALYQHPHAKSPLSTDSRARMSH